MFIRSCAAAVVLFACAAFGIQAQAQAQVPAVAPAATIQLQIIKGSYLIGVTGGEGALYFQGQVYPVGMAGVSIGLSIGGSRADLIGEVYNLYSPADIEGVYGATNASYAVAGGDSAIILRNARGVELHLRGKQMGLEFSVDLSGMRLTLE